MSNQGSEKPRQQINCPTNQNIQLQQERKEKKKFSKSKIALLQRTQVEFNRFFTEYLNKALECPISQELMTDPVVVSSGYTFDRKSIQDSIRVRGLVCPMSRQVLKPNQYTPNMTIRSLVNQYETFLKKQQTITEQIMKHMKKKTPNRMTIEEYQKMYTKLTIDPKKRLLKHDFKKVEINDFVRCNWSLIEEMDLTFCQIDDQGIETILKNGGNQFRNIRTLHLDNNKITTIKQLQRLPKLRHLTLENNDDLTSQTRDYLFNLNAEKGKLKIQF